MNHPYFRHIIWLLLGLGTAIFSFTSCGGKRTVLPAFYYWKTTFQLNGTEQQLLKDTKTKVLYMRFFDLDEGWENYDFPIVPVSQIDFKDSISNGVNVVPVVFINNKPLAKIDSSQIKELAAKLRRKIDRMCEKNGIAAPTEYQLDCDWTPKSKANFFNLVTELKKQVQPAKVSVTIRLHQYKYAAKTGVPPADRGLLMFYNMGHLEDQTEDNYILDIEEAKKYLTKKVDYPVPLDIGLPVYSQGVCYHYSSYRNTVTLMQGEEVEADIANGWLKATTGNWYEQAEGKANTSPHYYSDYIKVRYEKITAEKLMEASELVKGLVSSDTCKVVFFHLDSFQCSNFKAHDFDKVVSSFK